LLRTPSQPTPRTTGAETMMRSTIYFALASVLAMVAVNAADASESMEEKINELSQQVARNHQEVIALIQAPKASCYGRRNMKTANTTNPTAPATTNPTTLPTINPTPSPPPAVECEGMILQSDTSQAKYLELQSCTSIKYLEIRGGPAQQQVVELTNLKKVDDYLKIWFIETSTGATTVKALNLEDIGGILQISNNPELPQDGVQFPALKSIGSNGGATCNSDINWVGCEPLWFANNYAGGQPVSHCANNPHAQYKEICLATAGCVMHMCQ